MTDRIDLTWPEGNGHPMRIVDQSMVVYGRDEEVIEAGHKVIKRSRVEFTVAKARPATETEVQKWKSQK